MKCVALPLIALAAVVLSTSPANAQIVPKDFDPPARTEWVPEGCRRSVPTDNPVLPSRNAWRNLHADEVNTDEISSALTPVFGPDWTAEAATYNTTGPSFDSDGNLYIAPLAPYEPVVLISLDAETGARRWAIPNTTAVPPGAATPMILQDPDNPGEELVYLPLYDRAIAVRTDGTTVWDVPTGLVQSGAFEDGVMGANYHPAADAIVGVTIDGSIYALDRKTGATLLDSPHQLPGERTPPGPPDTLPPVVWGAVDAIFKTFVNMPPGSTVRDFRDLLRGNNTEVANHFSIDPNTSRIFVAATAPDAADGTVDGVSELGAIYGLDLVPNGSGYQVVEACSRFFEGGSASTPALRTDGTRLYLGDNFGKLIALNPDCSDAWELDLGRQIFGSIAVSSDNGELYASSADGVFKVVDEGDQGVLQWSAPLDVFEIPPPLQAAGFVNLNLNLVGIGANGLFVQAAAGLPTSTLVLPVTVGIAHLDRDTGAVRWFAEGLEETVAVMSTGPDGAIYVGNSPLRRIFAFVLSQFGQLPYPTPPVIGGITKWTPERLDLLVRDAVCATEDRARNADENRVVCPESAVADIQQIEELIDQVYAAGPKAVAAGDLSDEDWDEIDKQIDSAESKLDPENLKQLGSVARNLGKACDVLE
jgi:outer membrane protein assembly factor BamB